MLKKVCAVIVTGIMIFAMAVPVQADGVARATDIYECACGSTSISYNVTGGTQGSQETVCIHGHEDCYDIINIYYELRTYSCHDCGKVWPETVETAWYRECSCE